MRPIRRVLQFTLLTLAVLYAGDYLSARFRIPGMRQTLGSVQVQTMWAIKQKNGRIDYELGDTQPQTCLRSIFPHLGYTPCWYLSSHAHQVIKVGDTDRGPRIPEWRADPPKGPGILFVGFPPPEVHNRVKSKRCLFLREG